MAISRLRESSASAPAVDTRHRTATLNTSARPELHACASAASPDVNRARAAGCERPASRSRGTARRSITWTGFCVSGFPSASDSMPAPRGDDCREAHVRRVGPRDRHRSFYVSFRVQSNRQRRRRGRRFVRPRLVRSAAGHRYRSVGYAVIFSPRNSQASSHIR
jgi:hypothetical protein